MKNNTISYKGIDLNSNILKFIKHMDVVEEYREELLSLSKSWDNLTLLSHFGNNNTNIKETKNNFSNLTSSLLNHLSSEILEKTIREMKFKAQISIDILIRNLFERTADIGFLATDENIKEFLLFHSNKYEKSYEESANKIKERFKEYIQKYSVYYDIVLMDTNGNILVQLDEENNILKSKDSIIKKALNSDEEYIESYKFHDFLPSRKRSLVYTSKIEHLNEKNEKQNIGVLCLCFRFKDEMKGIFENLKNTENKECLCILDQDGSVIASSDSYHVALGTKLPYTLKNKYQLITFAGRDYLAKTCKTTGYQEYKGQKWFGHIMIPLEYAFCEIEDSLNIDQSILLEILQQGQGFNDELKKIPIQANHIQSNLNRLVWNGNINKSCDTTANKNFSRALLNEISVTGEKTKRIFDLSISNLTKTIILNNTSYVASLMIDIMDRNLYERANDCRWWALTDSFRQTLSSNLIDIKNNENLNEILKYINNLYTVYTNLFVYDNNGIIQSVSNDDQQDFIGKQLPPEVVEKTLQVEHSNDYFVSNFERTKLYNDDYTYIYYASIKDESRCVGGIGIVFNSKVEFKAMLEESIPNYSKNKEDEVFGIYAKKDQTIISSTNSTLKVGEKINLDSKFFNLKNGESYSEIVIYDGKYYAVGVKCSQGYREYKTQDNYSNDIFSIFFSYISSAHLKITEKQEIFTENTHLIQNENTQEIASFYIGGKWLGVQIEDVLEAVSIKNLELSPTIDKEHYFKGTVVYKQKAVAVIDIKNFIDEPEVDCYKEIVIVKNFDMQSEHYIGIMVNSLGDIPEISKQRIKKLDEHLLGNCTLIDSIVTPLEKVKYDKILSILDISKLNDNLTE